MEVTVMSGAAPIVMICEGTYWFNFPVLYFFVKEPG